MATRAPVKTYNGNMLWETNIPGMYIGIEVTNINFGGQYWGEKILDKLEQRRNVRRKKI